MCKDTPIDNTVKGRNLYPGCRINICQEYIYPNFHVLEKTIFLHWTAHLPLGQTEWPITAAGLRPRLAELRDNAGRFICPALAPGVGMDLPELRCFDPNSCDCIRFEDSKGFMEFERDYTAHHEKCLFPLEGLARPCLDAEEEKPEKCEFNKRTHACCLDTTGIYGPGKPDIMAEPCHSGRQCLVVRYMRRLDVSSDTEVHPHWYQALDPDSYRLTDDRDGLGVYWCRQQRCRNYHGRIPGFSRIIYGEEYSRRCPRTCE